MPGDLPIKLYGTYYVFFLSVSPGRKSSAQLHAQKPILRDMLVKRGASKFHVKNLEKNVCQGQLLLSYLENI